MFIATDHRAGDPSQAGADQPDGRPKDSKDRWVAMNTDSAVSL